MGDATIILLVIAIVLSLVAIAMSWRALQGEQRVRAAYQRFSRGNREDVLTLIDMHIREVQDLRQDVAYINNQSQQLRGLISSTLSRVGVVRYDAFDDMGGRLSFSAALLDEHGDGLVITAMNGRQQTRTYAKPVYSGGSSHHLSVEEISAIDRAINPSRPEPVNTGQDHVQSTQQGEQNEHELVGDERDYKDPNDYLEVIDNSPSAPLDDDGDWDLGNDYPNDLQGN